VRCDGCPSCKERGIKRLFLSTTRFRDSAIYPHVAGGLIHERCRYHSFIWFLESPSDDLTQYAGRSPDCPTTGNRCQHACGFWGNVSWQRFNGLEVTGLVAKRFLSLPYGIVSAHSRHLNLHM